MKIYIAGKITGDPNYRRKFDKEAFKLKSNGHIVLNPAILPKGMEHHEYMHICFSMIDVADLIYFLPCWKDSKGAVMEYEYAKQNGKSCTEAVRKYKL